MKSTLNNASIIARSSESSTLQPRPNGPLHWADLDALILRASEGDRRAIGVIAFEFGPSLIKGIRGSLGLFAQDAADVLQEFYVEMLEGQSFFPPDRGRAIPWMHRILRAMARKYATERELEWGLGGDDDT
jgi:DNA-directed RNA polymerase specialized sigma24 family protein